jgi:chromosome segregation ATPase
MDPMNDFDMVRATPRSPAGQAALDRIQAALAQARQDLEDARMLKLAELGGDFTTISEERDRLRDQVEELSARPDWTAYTALQEERDSFGHQLARANGEVSRLHERLRDTQRTLVDIHAELTASRAEVSRLRAHDAQMTTQVVNFKLEIERLRAEVEGLENLRYLVDRDTSEKDALKDEVSKLRAEVEESATLGEQYYTEVSRLKAMASQHRENAMEMSRVATTREGREAYEWAAAHIELLAALAEEKE